MQTFSTHIQKHTPETQRRLYTLFQREVKAGRLPALKLLTRFELQDVKGQPRQVQDFAYTDETGAQVLKWIEGQTQPTKKGFVLEQIQTLSDAELTALIQQQQKPIKKRKPKAEKGGKKTITTEQVAQSKANDDEAAQESMF